jgi:putative membrane protein
MYTGRIYRLIDMAKWTRFESFIFVLIVSVWSCVYYFFDLEGVRIPWTPMALIGTAVAFMIGFQNNAVYDRIWEARKIWGGIVNESRTFGIYAQAMLSNEYVIHENFSEEEIHREVKALTYRHIAWLTALRYSMRTQKNWETTSNNRTNREWGIDPPEWSKSLEESLKDYIGEQEIQEILSKDNRQTALLYQQSRHIKELKERGLIWEFSFLELQGLIQSLLSLQGKTERIKNFPYPRQYATLNHYFMWLLLLLLPVALIPQFIEIGNEISNQFPVLAKAFIWISIPIYTAVAWMFHTMERIGRTGENPFEGTSNDVPISAIARGIEIDLRQNLGEESTEIPDQFPENYGVQF